MNELERVEARVCADDFGLPDAPGRFVGSPGFACFLAWDGERQASSYRNIVRAGFREAYLRPNRQSPR